jgi:hypothetical protein
LTHGRALLVRNGYTTVITADLRNPGSILGDPALLQLIDPTKPVAVLLIAVLHFIRDKEKPGEVVKAFQSWMAPGSYLAVSHVDRTPAVASAAKVYDRATSPGVPRTRDQVLSFFNGFELVEPGLVPVPSWRPHEGISHELYIPWWGGVARHSGAGGTDG